MKWTHVAACALLGLLSACGGGGGGGGPSPPVPGNTFTLSSNAVSFSAMENAAVPSSQSLTVTITGANVAYAGAAYTGGQTQPSWLAFNMTGSGTLYQLTLSISSTALSPGTYTSTFAVGTTDSKGNVLQSQNVTVTYTVTPPTPTITPSPSSLVLGGTDGLSSTLQANLAFTLDNVGTTTYPYTVALSTTAGGNWLLASSTSGTVNASGTTLQISANRGSLVGGTYTGQVQITATVGSQVVTSTIPVTLNIEANRIVVGAAGVGFSSLTAGSVLTRNVTVFSNLGRTDVPWQASSDQSWLTATASGVTGGAITLTATPTGLTDGTYFANVTVKSSDTTVENQETIRVGLYVAATTPTNLSKSVPAQYLAADPVEPIVFINNGGTSVTGYNVYTGAVDRTFSGVTTSAGSMVVSQDGQRLYVYDQGAMAVVELDAASGATVHTYDSTLSGYSGFGGALGYMRPSGYAMIVTPSARAYDVNTYKEYDSQQWSSELTSADSLAVISDSSRIATESGAMFFIKRSALNGGVLNVSSPFVTGTTQGAAGQACFSADGLTLFTASGAPYNFYGTNLSTLTPGQVLAGQAYPNAIACAWNGQVIGGTSAYYSANDIFVYDATGTQLATLDSSSMTNGYRQLLARGLALSADNTRLITLVSQNSVSQQGNEVRFQSLP